MKLLRRALMPVYLGVLTITVFAGCDAVVDVRRGHHYSGRVWGSDPYCRGGYGYGYGYGCRMNNRDSGRLHIIVGRRHHWGRHFTPDTMLAERGTSWEQEFSLNDKAVTYMKNAFDNALDGKTEQLKAIGFSYADIKAMKNFGAPSTGAIKTAAQTLNVKQGDLSDFLEVFTLRMKTSYETNERYE